MTSSVIFDRVSKRYDLGLTRTSLPSAVTNALRNTFGGAGASVARERTLWALRDVSFELQPGQSMALVGGNGAGKSTILKLLANITKPTSGRIEVNGQLSALIELGTGFHPDLTGRENIYLNAAILGLRRQEIDRRFDEIVDFSELERFIDTPVKRYSSGMTVRLGFAVASCIEPEILLVDEVLAVGDAAFREKCMKRIQSLVENGTSTIFVSHNLYLVRAVCKQALYVAKGEIKARGSTTDVIKAYEKDLHEQRKSKLHAAEAEIDPSGDDLEITKVEVVGPDGASGGVLHSQQPAELRIHYLAHRSIGPVSAAAHITRSDGVTCCMMRTSLDDVRFSLNRGQGVITVALQPLQLIGGTYFAEGHFLDEKDSMGIVSSRSDWFSVDSSTMSFEARSGVYQPFTKWAHQEHGLNVFSNNGMAESSVNGGDVIRILG